MTHWSHSDIGKKWVLYPFWFSSDLESESETKNRTGSGNRPLRLCDGAYSEMVIESFKKHAIFLNTGNANTSHCSYGFAIIFFLQFLYPPHLLTRSTGSIFRLVTSAAVINLLDNLLNRSYWILIKKRKGKTWRQWKFITKTALLSSVYTDIESESEFNLNWYKWKTLFIPSRS